MRYWGCASLPRSIWGRAPQPRMCVLDVCAGCVFDCGMRRQTRAGGLAGTGSRGKCGSRVAGRPVLRMDLHSWEELIMPERVEITGPVGDRYEEILTQEAADLLAALHGELAGRRAELLTARRRRQAELSAGAMLDFLPATADIREDTTWRVAPPAPGLVDRRVEITGPTDRKMTINALNSGANVWLADFEDANTPLWDNMITGQLNLKDALDRTIDFTSEEGKVYALGADDELATIVV